MNKYYSICKLCKSIYRKSGTILSEENNYIIKTDKWGECWCNSSYKKNRIKIKKNT